MNPTSPKYTPGHTPNATAFLAARDLESHGFFLSPFLQPGFDVLDAGCGPGTITAGIAQAVFPGHVAALDIAPGQLEHGRRLCEGREIVNVDFVAGSSHELPFATESFDIVFAHALLEHLLDPMQTMQEFHRVTRPGGFIAVCSPDWDHCELTRHTKHVGRAIEAYRKLLESNGGDTRAGAFLGEWVEMAGYMPLSHDEWVEEYEDTAFITEFLAAQLAKAGQFHHATALRNWAQDPQAKFRQSWKFATGVRADANRRNHHTIIE